MKTPFTHLLAAATVFLYTGTAQSQSYTLNWGSSFSTAWTDGAVSRTANNIGGSGVNCSVNITKTGGTFGKPFGNGLPGPITPSVNGDAYVTVGGSANSLLLGVDFSTNTQVAEFTFTFSSLVPNVTFNIADIDRLTSNSRSYLDKIVVTGTNGIITINPTISRYTSIEPTFLQISGNTVNVNPTDGIAENAISADDDQRGTVIVNFGITPIRTFKVTYGNVAGAQVNPGIQNVSIGNIRFNGGIVLPVNLTSWLAKPAGNAVSLEWSAENEEGLAYFSIERSREGGPFSEVARIRSQAGTAPAHSFKDDRLTAGNYLYRLRMEHPNGQYTYSKTVTARIEENEPPFRVYPTLFTSQLQVALPAAEGNIQLTITNMQGQRYFYRQFGPSGGGLKTIPTDGLPAGTYLVSLQDERSRNSQLVIKR